MSNKEFSKDELIKEINKLRKRNDELESYIKEKNLYDNFCSTSNATDSKSRQTTGKGHYRTCMENIAQVLSEDALKESRIKIEAELADTKLLQSISIELLNEDNTEAFYERIADAAMKVMHSQYASMQMLHYKNDTNDKLQLLAYRGFNAQAAKFWEWVDAKDACSTCGEALRTGKRIVAPNVEECDFMQGTSDLETYLQTGIHAVQTTPLYSRSGEMLGMISTHWKKPHVPTERELRLLDVLARQAADLIEQKLSKDKLRESEEKYRKLFQHMNEGFFLAEIIYDEGKPIDYIHLAANPAIDGVIGLDCSEIIGKTGREIKMTSESWINVVNQVAVTGESLTLDGFSFGFDRHFLIRVFSPKKGQFACLIQDTTEWRKLEEELKYQKDLFKSVIENMHDAIIIYNKNGETAFINAEARKYSPYLSYQKAVGNVNNGLEYFDSKGSPIPKENMPTIRVLKGEKIRNKRVVTKGFNLVQYTEVNATPIFDDKNNLTSAVISYHDITKLVENEQQIRNHQEEMLRAEQEKRETIEAAMKLKDEFLYLITHEFKTPIAVISSVLQTIDSLLKDDISERLEKYLNMIKMNTNRQLRLVNNLLDITRLNSGHIKIKNRSVDIVNMTKSIVKSVEIYARQKQINLNLISDLEKREVYLDEEKFERIILNLLSNALKFTPKGKNINVLLSVQKLEDKSFVSVSVEDEGIGIPLDKQKLIFDRFGQADTSLSRQAEGTGLGLYLVKLLINVLGGEIKLKSEQGKGSTFTILLPTVNASEFEDEDCFGIDNELISSDERIIQAASIEFSDIYFD